MTLYDYFDTSKKSLSSNGRKPEITLLKGFNNTSVLHALGRKGYVKGEALRDYLRIVEKDASTRDG